MAHVLTCRNIFQIAYMIIRFNPVLVIDVMPFW